MFKDILKNRSKRSNLSEEVEKAIRELLEYRENVKKEIIGNTQPLSHLPEKQRITLKNMVREAYEDVKRFFNIEVDYFPEIEITEGGKSYAHYDKEVKKLRVSKKLLELLLKSDPEKLKAGLAEELTHAIRDYKGLSDYTEVEEFFGHLAKLNEGYEKGEGEELLKKYVRERDGKWNYEEIEKIYKGLEEKIDYFVKLGNSFIDLRVNIEPKLSKEGRKEFREKIGKFFAENVNSLSNEIELLRENLPLSAFEDESDWKWISKNIEKLAKFVQEEKIEDLMESPESAKKYLEFLGEKIKDSLKDVKRIAYETEPYKYRSLLRRSYESLKVHARGYSTAEEVFKYIQQGKIEASDLFYKDPGIIKMLLFDGKKTDYMKKFAWKAYAEVKNFERKLKSYFSRG